MNFLKKTKKIRKKIHVTGLKVLTTLNILSLLFFGCSLDSMTGWKLWVIMLGNVIWIFLIALVNGWFYDTRSYYERLEDGTRKEF